MNTALALASVNAATDLLVVIAIGYVNLQRRDAFTRYLLLAFLVWLVNDLAEVLMILRVLPYHVVFYNLSTLNSAAFLMAVAHLRRGDGASRWGPGGLWRSDLVNPVTFTAALVILATLVLQEALPQSRIFAVPDLLLAAAMWVLMGWALYTYVARADRFLAAICVVTFTSLTGLMIGLLLLELGLLPPTVYLPFRLASVMTHLLIIYTIAHVVARGLWRKLDAEQRDLTRILESSPSAILLVTAAGQVERVNATGRRLLGAGAVEGADIEQLLPGVGWSAERVGQLAPGALLLDHAELPRPDEPEPRHVRVYVAPLTAGDAVGFGRRQRYVLIASDIAHELERERLALESERAKTLSILSGGTIHHFHNKLIAIRTGLRFIEGRMPVEQSMRLRLPLLVKATDQAFALSNQLAGNLRVAQESEYETVDMRSLAAAALDDTAERRPDGVTCVLDDGTGLPPQQDVLVRGVPQFLKMVLENLITNAYDALAERGHGQLTLRLSVVASPATVRLEFEDDGTGVPDAVRHQLFVPFFTTKERAGGTGFGLYWSRRLVEAIGGHLALDWSEVGRGTCFLLELPWCRGEAAGNPGSADPESSHEEPTPGPSGDEPDNETRGQTPGDASPARQM